jgi:GNAT superfamily N-acetyltransferase
MSTGAERPWLIEPLAKRHDRDGFFCGKAPLDNYIKQQARQDASRHVAAPFVAVPKPGDSAICGYYTLSAYAIDPKELPETTIRKLPRYSLLPTTLLGRLAVDHRHRGCGLGQFLLLNALGRALSQSHQIAAFAVVVEAIDDEAWHFYRHFNFVPFLRLSDRLFLPMRTIADLFADD